VQLDVKEERTFQAEVDTMNLEQKEAIMQATTSWEEIGIEKERRSLVSLQLEQKVGELSDRLSNRVDKLSPEQLKALAIALLRFESIDDLTTWLENRG
jgi:coenzyme F420-reducing hydrogenase delta subunit